MFKSSLRQVARSSQTSIPSRSAPPSITSFTSGRHQRRHSSSKPPVPPDNGSPTFPSDVKSVSSRSEAKTESKKSNSERTLRKKHAAAKVEHVEPQDNWTSSMPRVPSLHLLNAKDLSVSAFYSTYRPMSITGPGPKEASMQDFEKMFLPRPSSKPKTKATAEVIHTLNSALQTLNNHIDTRLNPAQDESAPSSQKQVFHVVDGAGNQFKITNPKDVQNVFRPFQPPPPPVALSQEQLDALDRQASAASLSQAEGEDLLAHQLEEQVDSQDAIDSAIARGQRDRARLDALLTPQRYTQTAEIVLNNAELREKYSFFTSTDPTAIVDAPSLSSRPQGTRQRRGFAVVDSRRHVIWRLISVKRQRKLKMKKHKYKKLMRKTRNLRKRQDKV